MASCGSEVGDARLRRQLTGTRVVAVIASKWQNAASRRNHNLSIARKLKQNVNGARLRLRRWYR